MVEKFEPLVSAAWLAQHLEDPNLRVIDFRWRYDHETGQGQSARPEYEAGHIPGAAFVDLEDDVTGHQPGLGRHPLPTDPVFEQAMRAAGLSADSRVVVYDDAAGFSAARLWWLLRYFGHGAVAVLDGGLQTWPGPLSRSYEPIARGSFIADPQPNMKLDYEEVRERPGSALLLDARRLERYLGLSEPVEARSGHIPGARSAHWGANLGLPGGRLYPASWSDWAGRERVDRFSASLPFIGITLPITPNLLKWSPLDSRGAHAPMAEA